jgi:hypothetical protein
MASPSQNPKVVLKLPLRLKAGFKHFLLGGVLNFIDTAFRLQEFNIFSRRTSGIDGPRGVTRNRPPRSRPVDSISANQL